MTASFPRLLSPALPLAALLLAGCDPRLIPTSDLSPREIQTLAGVWEGRSPLRSGGKDCPAVYLWTLRVGNGNVDGEVVDAATPRAPASKFTTFLDYDGTVHAQVRPGGRDATIRGAFNRDSFAGEVNVGRVRAAGDVTMPDCRYFVRLRRAASS